MTPSPGHKQCISKGVTWEANETKAKNIHEHMGVKLNKTKGEFIIQPCDSHKKIAPNNYKSVEVYLKYTAKLLYF